MGQLAEGLLGLSGWAALAFLFVLPALEAPAFLGLVLPGEVALILGGVLAARDRIPLAAALAVGTAGALAGDTAGYWIGRRWGPWLLATNLGPGRNKLSLALDDGAIEALLHATLARGEAVA